jgi:RNA polymerase sigma-70 factor (ECF subfamily)
MLNWPIEPEIPFIPDETSGKLRVDVVEASERKSGAELAGRIQAGDQRAEEELVQQCSRGVSVIIGRIVGDRSATEDLHQETFRIALEKIRAGEVREPEALFSFIAGLAKNLAVDYMRRESRRETLVDLKMAQQLPDHAASPLDQVLQQEHANIIRQVLNGLNTDRDREVLFRFYINEERKEQICADLGLSSLHFDRVLHRARQRYKELYEKLVGRSSAKADQPGDKKILNRVR